MISDNREKNLAICQDIVDGKWSNWTDLGDCKGLQQVENYSCGPGYQHRERKCARTLGGKFCQVDGEDYEGRIMRISVECDSGDCPGFSCSVKQKTHFNLIFLVWEDNGTCIAPSGKKGSIKQVLKLGEKIIRERKSACFTGNVNGT